MNLEMWQTRLSRKFKLRLYTDLGFLGIRIFGHKFRKQDTHSQPIQLIHFLVVIGPDRKSHLGRSRGSDSIRTVQKSMIFTNRVSKFPGSDFFYKTFQKCVFFFGGRGMLLLTRQANILMYHVICLTQTLGQMTWSSLHGEDFNARKKWFECIWNGQDGSIDSYLIKCKRVGSYEQTFMESFIMFPMPKHFPKHITQATEATDSMFPWRKLQKQSRTSHAFWVTNW